MKKFFLVLFLLLCTGFVFGQSRNDTIVVAPGASGLHFYHIIQKEESLNSLSHKFNVPKDKILSINDLRKVEPYQIIKIPIPSSDFIQSGSVSQNKNLKPLFHQVSKGETLYRVGKLYNDLSPEKLRSWNNIQGNNIHVNQYLIVGWLKSQPSKKTNTAKKEENNLRKTDSVLSLAREKSENKKESENKKKEEDNGFLHEVISSERKRVKTNQKSKNLPVSKPLLSNNQPHNNQNSQRNAVEALLSAPEKAESRKKENTQISTPIETQQKESKKIAKKEEKKSIPQKKKADDFEKMLNEIAPSSNSKKEEKTTIAQTSTPQKKKPEQEEISKPESALPKDTSAAKHMVMEKKEADTSSLTLAQKSIFSDLYRAQSQDETLLENKKGAAGWFKSNIKPGSKKYYALCNDLPRGTIIKVINPLNNNFVYAKVLSEIPTSKENYNLVVKLSDAAKQDLGINESRFWSEIIFPQVNGH